MDFRRFRIWLQERLAVPFSAGVECRGIDGFYGAASLSLTAGSRLLGTVKRAYRNSVLLMKSFSSGF